MSSRGRPRLARPHGEVELEADVVALLRDAAAALAGQSSAAGYLSLLLGRAPRHELPVVLRRSEVKLLRQLATTNGLTATVGLLSDTA